MSAPKLNKRRVRGFTFVELLVAMGLIGLMSLALVGGLRFGTRAWEGGTRQAQEAGQVERAQNLLRRQLAQPLARPAGNREVSGAFAGDTDHMVFVASWFAAVGGSGLTAFQVSSGAGTSGPRLMLRWHPFRQDWDGSFSDDPERSRILLEGLEELSITYYGLRRGTEDAGWSDSWVEQPGPPTLIAIEGRFAEADHKVWPRLVIAPRTAMRLPG